MYDAYESYKDWLRDEFVFRCVYCLSRETWFMNGAAALKIDHLIAKSHRSDLTCDYDNLVLACGECNKAKGARELLDVTAATLGTHLRAQSDGKFAAITPQGARLIEILHLNKPNRVRERSLRLDLAELCRQSPDKQQGVRLLHALFGYPDDLPDLGAMRPKANRRPDGVKTCHFQRRNDGTLPATY